jgi:cytidylate kinase
VIVAISNDYGSGALEVARRVAATLGYQFVDRQLPVVVAKRLRVSREAVEANEEAVPSLGERFLSGLERATPELAEASAEPFDEELLRAVQRAVREYAARGNVVIVGRGAAAILGARPDVLRVFVHAPREWRVRQIVRTTGASLEVAQAEVDRIDRARRAYIRDWYGLTLGDPQNYDLSLDASRLGVAESAALVVAAARSKDALP